MERVVERKTEGGRFKVFKRDGIDRPEERDKNPGKV